jgi:hypothetical protein
MLVSSPFNKDSLATDAIVLPARAARFYASVVCSLTIRPPCGPRFSQHQIANHKKTCCLLWCSRSLAPGNQHRRVKAAGIFREKPRVLSGSPPAPDHKRVDRVDNSRKNLGFYQVGRAL